MKKFSLAEASRPYLAGDLEWVIYSPSLLADKIKPDLTALPQSREIVEEVRQNPSQLLNFLGTMKRQNLGTYFEHLVYFWLDQLDAVDVIVTNLQIHNENTTIGEIDVVFTYRNQNYHWELAVKFYANLADGGTESQWVGPLKRDNLQRKLDRLYGHQLTISGTQQAKQLLADKGIDQLKAYPFVKGMLFNIPDAKPSNTELPDRISPKCTLGTWVTLHKLKLAPLDESGFYCLLYKPRWISTVSDEDWTEIGDMQDFIQNLHAIFDKNPTPVLIAFGSQTLSDIRENSRIFVMPDDWNV